MLYAYNIMKIWNVKQYRILNSTAKVIRNQKSWNKKVAISCILVVQTLAQIHLNKATGRNSQKKVASQN